MKRISLIRKAIAYGCFVSIDGVGEGTPLEVRKRHRLLMVKVEFFFPFTATRWVSDKRGSRYYYLEMA